MTTDGDRPRRTVDTSGSWWRMPSRDPKRYNRLLLRCLAAWVAIGLVVLAVIGFTLTGVLLTASIVLGLGNTSAWWIDRRWPV